MRLSAEQAQQALEMRKAGKTLKAIAVKFNVNVMDVYRSTTEYQKWYVERIPQPKEDEKPKPIRHPAVYSNKQHHQ